MPRLVHLLYSEAAAGYPGVPFEPLELDPMVTFGVGCGAGGGVGGMDEGPVTVWLVETELEL